MCAELSKEEVRLRELEDLATQRTWNRQENQDVANGLTIDSKILDQAQRQNVTLENTPWQHTVEVDTGKSISRVKGADRLGSMSDSVRYATKLRLYDIASAYRKEAEGDDTFLGILNLIQQYAETDATALKSREAKEENEMYNKIFQSIAGYIESVVADPEHANWDSFQKCNMLYAYFNERKNGDLEVPADGVMLTEEDYKMNDATVKVAHSSWGKTVTEEEKADEVDVKDLPLFAHEPSVNDISQGGLGDCYFLAGLASVVTADPKAIKESMRDDGNGFVTVRLYKPVKKDDGISSSTEMVPIYVQVSKKVPKYNGNDTYAKNCLWVQMMERAYAVSRQMLEGKNTNKVDVTAAYENVKAKMEKGRETLMAGGLPAEEVGPALETLMMSWRMSLTSENPFYKNLFTADGKLKSQDEVSQLEIPKMEVGYQQIIGGFSDVAVMHITGKKKEAIDTVATYRDEIHDLFSDIVKDHAVRERQRTGQGGADQGSNPLDELIKEQVTKSNRRQAPPDELVSEIRNSLFMYINQQFLGRFGSEKAGKAQVNMWMKKFIKEECFKAKENVNPKLFDVLNRYGLTPKSPMVKTIVEKMCKFTASSVLSEMPKLTCLNGTYIPSEEQVFQNIEQAIAAGKMVTTGTRRLDGAANGLNGEAADTGIYGTHAYTVLGTEIRNNVKYIKVRNPWGSMGRDYSMGKKNVMQFTEFADNQGFFLVELSDFAARFDELGSQ